MVPWASAPGTVPTGAGSGSVKVEGAAVSGHREGPKGESPEGAVSERSLVPRPTPAMACWVLSGRKRVLDGSSCNQTEPPGSTALLVVLGVKPGASAHRPSCTPSPRGSRSTLPSRHLALAMDSADLE